MQNRRQVEDLPPVLFAIADVQVPIHRSVVLVSLMNVVGAGVQEPDHRKADAARPGVICVDVDLRTRPPPCVQQKTVIVLSAAVIILSQISEVCLRIRQIEYAALVHVSCR